MILEIGSSIETFKTLTFRRGLNILLAERNETSQETDTRNGAGKSSVIQIVHFLLGGDKTADMFLRFPEIAGASFWGEFEFSGIRVRVRRDVSNSGVVYPDFPSGIPDGLMATTDILGLVKVQNDDWKAWLGHVAFGLPLERKKPPFNSPHAPTFRSLMGYFARRRENGGFQSATQFQKKQSESAQRIALSYLFGLDWTLAIDFEVLREDRQRQKAEDKRLKAKLDAKTNTISRIFSAMTAAEAEADAIRKDVSNFQVEQHFDELVSEADAEKAKLEKLAREAARLTTSLRHLKESLEQEIPADADAVGRVYSEAGINLPGSVSKRFDDVRIFHESVLANRRVHLGEELASVEARLGEVDVEKSIAANRRSAILRQLEGKGAFSDLAAMQQRLANKEEAFARLRAQFEDAQSLQTQKTKSKTVENSLLLRLQNDLAARSDTISEAVMAVHEARTALYADRWGAFEINALPSGPEFKVEIESGNSGGIANMEIFCFDYALYKVVSKRLGGLGFLIHDSHLFDPVDSRQKATALELGALLTAEVGGQYIALLNSDEFERLEFPEGFDARSHVLPVVLEDTPEGGLFGFRFG
ncbi:ABC-three component system protein [Sinorhizobium meliloti]|uniref:ABC-three component system protein n=1 Tax=Rhizobium meliloti TaxID=382 RepID=UPI0002EC0122|nr:ABC-three component system protein [Sinorhizobium meliloti]MDE4593054.1 DUF2326 domain-containing protein [Sinorhizobium meliloti]